MFSSKNAVAVMLLSAALVSCKSTTHNNQTESTVPTNPTMASAQIEKFGTIDGFPRFISVATPVALQSGKWRTVLVRTKGKITAVSQPEIGPAAEKRRGFLD